MSQVFKQQLDDLLEKAPETIGVSIRGINTPFSYGWNEDEPLSTASTMKLMVLGALLEKCQQGEENLERFISYQEGERVGGSGILLDLTPGLTLTVKDAAVLMIVLSDNTATNMCIDLCGGVDAVNRHIGRLQIQNCSINRKLGENSEDPAKRNLSDTSARGFVDYLLAVREGKALNPAFTEIFFDILRKQRYKDMFGRYLPLEDYFEEEASGYPVLMNKTGFMLGVRTDAGILRLPDGREYAYAVMINEEKDETYAVTNKGAELIGLVGKMFYDAIADSAIGSESIKTE
ncbi:MAG: serine hydrolase [Firmicutes bacterium]|nr:serine hydrolase [Bacillota bacterium]